MDDFLKRLHAHDWASEPQTLFNPIEGVPAALEAVWRDDAKAFWTLRDAVANQCSDAWFPVLLGAMPFMTEIIVRGPEGGAGSVMRLLANFAKYYHADFDELEKVPERERAFVAALEALEPLLLSIAASNRPCAREAVELIAAIGERRQDRGDAAA